MDSSGGSRWESTDAPRGVDYDARWRQLEAEGKDPHGEVACLMTFEPRRVLDAGCGTGRVAIELANRGVDVVGFDLDPRMLETARSKAPLLRWIEADAATIDLTGQERFDVVVLAGNVMIFVEPGTEGRVLSNMARHLRPGGRLVTGFSLTGDRYGLESLDSDAQAAGLIHETRWSTWEQDPWSPDDVYAVSVFRTGDRV